MIETLFIRIINVLVLVFSFNQRGEDMIIELLGSGGAIPIPRPLCNCNICKEARIKGVPYSRMGPSVFIHDINLLIDTPEDIVHQINRSNIEDIKYCIYSHWHPDHTMGRRVFEMNHNFRSYLPKDNSTKILIPEGVMPGFRERLGIWNHFEYFKQIGIIETIILSDNSEYKIDNAVIKPIRLKEEYVYGFLIESLSKRVLIIMDELIGWEVPKDLGKVDLAVLPAGVFEFNPITNVRNLPVDTPTLKLECTFLETLHIVDNLNADKIVLSHIEELDKLSYDDLIKVEEIYRKKGIDFKFAYDGMKLEI
ncbi:metallo-hydrolase/oxidoreductase [Vallitalea longa]|uniref:Metallo-hydrolase/oxidoreductase n=2 Tax=Vallitalea longa TaxID=2936439 RepID=A0A9W5YGR5_9FIRM|nr:metallo-hydrolase/oxidoreductase [Vallitalea longa]